MDKYTKEYLPWGLWLFHITLNLSYKYLLVLQYGYQIYDLHLVTFVSLLQQLIISYMCIPTTLQMSKHHILLTTPGKQI